MPARRVSTSSWRRCSTAVNQRLHENADLMQQTQRTLGERLDSTAQVVGAVHRSLGGLEEANRKIYEIGKDIASLQQILRAPKLRGGLGELLLEDLLAQILPPSTSRRSTPSAAGRRSTP